MQKKLEIKISKCHWMKHFIAKMKDLMVLIPFRPFVRNVSKFYNFRYIFIFSCTQNKHLDLKVSNEISIWKCVYPGTKKMIKHWGSDWSAHKKTVFYLISHTKFWSKFLDVLKYGEGMGLHSLCWKIISLFFSLQKI